MSVSEEMERCSRTRFKVMGRDERERKRGRTRKIWDGRDDVCYVPYYVIYLSQSLEFFLRSEGLTFFSSEVGSLEGDNINQVSGSVMIGAKAASYD